jgi:hypothetical protein
MKAIGKFKEERHEGWKAERRTRLEGWEAERLDADGLRAGQG